MENNPVHFDPGDQTRKSIPEQLDEIRQMKFKFGCLGINCLGWIIIIAAGITLYFILS